MKKVVGNRRPSGRFPNRRLLSFERLWKRAFAFASRAAGEEEHHRNQNVLFVGNHAL